MSSKLTPVDNAATCFLRRTSTTLNPAARAMQKILVEDLHYSVNNEQDPAVTHRYSTETILLKKELKKLSRQITRRPVVLNIGCGFCTRFLEVPGVDWVEVDDKSVLELRNKVYRQFGSRPQYSDGYLRGNTVRRLDNLYADIVIAEGVFQYLDVETIAYLLTRYPVVIFDVHKKNDHYTYLESEYPWKDYAFSPPVVLHEERGLVAMVKEFTFKM